MLEKPKEMCLIEAFCKHFPILNTFTPENSREWPLNAYPRQSTFQRQTNEMG